MHKHRAMGLSCTRVCWQRNMVSNKSQAVDCWAEMTNIRFDVGTEVAEYEDLLMVQTTCFVCQKRNKQESSPPLTYHCK